MMGILGCIVKSVTTFVVLAPGPRWIRTGLTVLCVPVVLGVVAILAQNGVSAPAQIGAIVGLAVGVLFHRCRLRSLSNGASFPASPTTHTTEAGEKNE